MNRQAVPVSYLRAVDGHLRRFPGDDHFIIELAEESGTGGNGFGTVTCESAMFEKWDEELTDRHGGLLLGRQ